MIANCCYKYVSEVPPLLTRRKVEMRDAHAFLRIEKTRSHRVQTEPLGVTTPQFTPAKKVMTEERREARRQVGKERRNEGRKGLPGGSSVGGSGDKQNKPHAAYVTSKPKQVCGVA